MESLNNSQLSDLVHAINDDIENLGVMRDSIAKIKTFPVLSPRRLPRKKLKYWKDRLNSKDPYIAYVANARITAHKLRVRQGRMAHKANTEKQRAKKR
jgi:hypothetical protein